MASQAVVRLNDRVNNDTFASVQFEYNEGGAALDITGNSIRIQFRKNNDRGAVVYEATTASGITLTNPTSGIFKLDAFNISGWETGTSFFDVEMTFTDGSIKTWVTGTVKILQSITE